MPTIEDEELEAERREAHGFVESRLVDAIARSKEKISSTEKVKIAARVADDAASLDSLRTPSS